MPSTIRRSRLRFIVVLMASILITGPVQAFQATPVASPEAAAGVYLDPGGAFTVPIPTGWTAETEAGYAHLTDPEGLIDVYLATVPEPDAEAAIAATWELVDPATERTPIDQLEIPPPAGVDRQLFIEYDDGVESGQVVQAVGQVVGETTYVLLIDSEVGAAVRRNSQIQTILGGFEILSVDEIDLAGVAPEALTPELLAELEAYIESALATHDVPGAAIAIVQDGEVVYRQGFGVRALGDEEPVTPETLMMIGSTTKPMTTTMMATLVDDGLIDWDTPVVEILPSFAVADPELTAAITIRDLVCACTGVPRRDLELVFNAAALSAADVIGSLAAFEFFTPIGEAFQYSNQMVAAGGYIATLAAGGTLGNLFDDYVALMRERVFDPVGMPDTTFSIETAASSPNHAVPHARGLDGSLQPEAPELEAVLDPVAPAGTAWSNVDDMARFVIMQLNEGVSADGERVVSAESLAETWIPRVPVSAGTSYGLGWFVDSYKGQPVIHHGGNTLGFTSDLAFLPEAELGIVTLTNAQGANLFTGAVRTRFLELVFAQAPEGDAMVAFALEQQEEVLADLAEAIGPVPDLIAVAPYVGEYANDALGEVELEIVDGRLIFDAGEFAAEVRVATGELGRVAGYLLVDGPLAGLPLDLRQMDGLPVLDVFDPTSTSAYPFTMAGSGATPVASPVP